MHFGIFSYAATVLIFTGLALLLRLFMRLFISRRSAKLQKSDWKVISLVMLIAAVATSPAELAMLSWRTWTYNPERSFHVTFLGAAVETYLFTILVTLVVSMATILYARREDQKRDKSANP